MQCKDGLSEEGSVIESFEAHCFTVTKSKYIWVCEAILYITVSTKAF